MNFQPVSAQLDLFAVFSMRQLVGECLDTLALALRECILSFLHHAKGKKPANEQFVIDQEILKVGTPLR